MEKPQLLYWAGYSLGMENIGGSHKIVQEIQVIFVAFWALQEIYFFLTGNLSKSDRKATSNEMCTYARNPSWGSQILLVAGNFFLSQEMASYSFISTFLPVLMFNSISTYSQNVANCALAPKYVALTTHCVRRNIGWMNGSDLEIVGDPGSPTPRNKIGWQNLLDRFSAVLSFIVILLRIIFV